MQLQAPKHARAQLAEYYLKLGPLLISQYDEIALQNNLPRPYFDDNILMVGSKEKVIETESPGGKMKVHVTTEGQYTKSGLPFGIIRESSQTYITEKFVYGGSK